MTDCFVVNLYASVGVRLEILVTHHIDTIQQTAWSLLYVQLFAHLA